MKPSKISVGDEFGDLTVERYAGLDIYRNRTWLCQCSCGQNCVVEAFRLTSGERSNCGRTHKAVIKELAFAELASPTGSAALAIWDFLYHRPPPVPAGEWLSRFD